MPEVVPLFDTRAQYEPLVGELRAALDGVLESGLFILGPEVEAFEREFASYIGVGHVVGVANGTDALTIALRALGVEAGDDVVCPSYTFWATAEAIVNAGARPVFCDVDPVSFCVTVQAVEAALTPTTRAVVPVHLYGNLAPMGDLRALCEGRGIRLLEDAAQAAGARLDGRRAGTLGHAATFSFFPSKNLFCLGDGGAITTDDAAVAEVARRLRFHGSRDKRSYQAVGYNSRLDALQAALLRRFLPHLDRWNEARRAVAADYAEAGIADLVVPPSSAPGAEPVHHLYVVRSDRRDALAGALERAGVQARAYYETPVHRQEPMRAYARDAELPGTEEAARTGLALPMHPTLARDQVERVVAALRTA